MPSYRVELVVGAVSPGVDPGSIVPRAAAAASEFTIVEASDVAVVAGQARVVVRFTESDADVALQVGGHVAAMVGTVAHVPSYRVTERVGTRWNPVRPG
ncbi:hypothetical protein BH11ACT2_BH11ACT2_00600 [soil metagenome]